MRRGLAVAGILAMLAAQAACRPEAQAPPTASSLADSADQVLFGLDTHISKEGVRQATLDADTAFFFDEGTRIELRDLRLTFFTTQGTRSAVLTSEEGTYNMRSSQMEARGNVVLVGEDGRRLTTEQLRYDQNTDQISSDSAFVSLEDGRRLEGIGFRANSDLTRWTCLQACRAGGNVSLPEPSGANAPAQVPPPLAPPRDTTLPELPDA